MKTKLSSLTLALLPFISGAAIAKSVEINYVEATTPAYDQKSVLIVFKDNQENAARVSTLSKVKAAPTDLVTEDFKNLLDGRIAKLKLDGVSVEDAVKILSKDPAIKSVEPNYILHALSVPNDSEFSKLWGMNNTGQDNGVDDADVDAPEAWGLALGDRKVLVGVIDTGIDHRHEDLRMNMWKNPGEIPNDGIDNDGNGFVDDVHGINTITGSGDPMDDNGHGTHVSGTIGASGNNGIGVVGVNHEVSLIGCKFLNAGGSGTTEDAVKCINYFIDLKEKGHDIRILNNSWGGGSFSETLSQAIEQTNEAGILFVAAAGNNGTDNDTLPHYPSNYESDNIIAVASTDRQDALSGFSCYGQVSVDLAAPGSDIYSTIPNGGYGLGSGTSMAAPHVAGAAALVLAAKPELTTAELKTILLESGDVIETFADKMVSGKRLNVHNAVKAVDPAPSYHLYAQDAKQQIVAGETATFTFQVAGLAGFDGEIDLVLVSSLDGAVLSSAKVKAGDIFTLEVPTAEQTPWGDYAFAIQAKHGDLEKDISVDLNVLPFGITDYSVAYSGDPISIPDADPTGITSVLNIVDDAVIFSTKAHVKITHPWIGDLTVTLVSPDGKEWVMHRREGGQADNIDTVFETEIFNTMSTAGDWTLKVSDSEARDVGQLESWKLTFLALGSGTAPAAGFDFAVDERTVQFTDLSTDRDNNITTWLWDFGDGNTSDQANPSHTYAEDGTYDVSLTVTDADGSTSTINRTVRIDTIDLVVDVKRAMLSRLGRLYVNLRWEGTDAEQVTIKRNGEVIATVPNTGRFIDRERQVEGNEFTYVVCGDDNDCSEPVVVNFDR
ncbi:S8 family serine peptidase [Algicola sagamiensis]|uniref:S8 family serine peptidase n=1 Tax=Algicola sagamiensis TaxID=163869 RepID=UPI00039ECB98|nr:S8 family serine peptidase [Algicola sagamiensis]